MERALRTFTAAEELRGDNQYRCAKCDVLVDASKRLTLHTLPKLLTVQLKRFGGVMGAMGWGGGMGMGQKINKKIAFPDVLNLTPFTSAACDAQPARLTKKQRKALRKMGGAAGAALDAANAGGESASERPQERFSLCGVVVHHGYAVHSGHYIAYVKAPNGFWYEMDDDDVSQVKKKTVMAQQAYLLFYQREKWSPPAPREGSAAAEQKAAAAAAEEEAAALQRKRRRTLSSSSSDSSDDDESGGSEEDDAPAAAKERPTAPVKVAIDDLPDHKSPWWLPALNSNLVASHKKWNQFQEIAARQAEALARRAAEKRKRGSRDGDGDIELDDEGSGETSSDESDVELSDSGESPARSAPSAAPARGAQPRDDPDTITVAVRRGSKRRAVVKLRCSRLERPRPLRTAPFDRPGALRRAYTHDLPRDGSVRFRTVVRCASPLANMGPGLHSPTSFGAGLVGHRSQGQGATVGGRASVP